MKRLKGFWQVDSMELQQMIASVFKNANAHTDKKGNVYLFFENISHMTVAGIYEFLKELGFGKINWTKKMALDGTDNYVYVLKCVPPKGCYQVDNG